MIFGLNRKKTLKLSFCIILTNLAGLVGSIFTAPGISGWYASLEKPFFTPPNWIFAPVWTTLFILMGIALYLVWEKGLEKKEVKIGVGIFGLQLMLNVIWSFLFFGLGNPFLALLEIFVLWATILATIAAFSRVSRKAAWLLAPYIVWVTLATFLNYGIWALNSGL